MTVERWVEDTVVIPDDSDPAGFLSPDELEIGSIQTFESRPSGDLYEFIVQEDVKGVKQWHQIKGPWG